jgi:hypothetical protein
MALTSRSLITVEEAKEELRIRAAESQHDSWLESLIDRVSGVAEHVADRNLIYRADTEDEDAVAASQSWTNGAVAVSSPSSPRALILSWIGDKPDAGEMLVTGTNPQDVTITEVISLDNPRGIRAFKTVASAVISGASGTANFNLGTQEPYIEYHSPVRHGSMTSPSGTLWSRVYPIADVIEINEDAARAYGSDTALNLTGSNADVVYSKGEGVFHKVKGTISTGELGLGWIDFPEDYAFRFSKSLPRFLPSIRSVRLVYTGGWRETFDRGLVESEIKIGVLASVVKLYRAAERKSQDLSSVITGVGQAQVASPGIINMESLKIFEGYKTRSRTFEEE